MGELLTISWPSHYQYLSEGIWSLLQADSGTDFEITVCESDGFQRHAVKVHYIILSTLCLALDKSAGKQKKFQFVNKLDVCEEDLRCIVEFIYRGKILVKAERLQVLKAAAKELGLKSLVELIDRKIKNRKGNRSRKAVDATKISSKRKTNKPVKISCNSGLKTSHYSLRKTRQQKQNYPSSEEPITIVEKNEISTEKCETLLKRKLNSGNRVKLEIGKKRHFARPKSKASNELVCYLCDRKFKNCLNFDHHMRCHKKPELLLKCPCCSLKAETSEQLKKHLASKHQMDIDGNTLDKNIRCPDCEYRCVAKFQLKNHRTFKHGARMHICDKCPYACHSRSALEKHKNGVHCDSRPFMCETCGFCSKTLGGLSRHTLIHQDKVVCHICGINLSSKALSRHVTMLHGDGGHRKQFPCHICSFATRDRYNLKVHLTNVHKMLHQDVNTILNKGQSRNAINNNMQLVVDESHSVQVNNTEENLLLFQLDTIL